MWSPILIWERNKFYSDKKTGNELKIIWKKKSFHQIKNIYEMVS